MMIVYTQGKHIHAISADVKPGIHPDIVASKLETKF